MNVEENILLSTIIQNGQINNIDWRDKYNKLLENVGLSKEIAKKNPINLSGGQKQRVALARAFYHGRNVLILDEATSSLDHEIEKEIVEEIRLLKGEKTLIVITHRLTTVQHCDRLYVLEKGEIIKEGPPEKILNMN